MRDCVWWQVVVWRIARIAETRHTLVKEAGYNYYSLGAGDAETTLTRVTFILQRVIFTSGVAQWLACWAHNPKVRGSKPRSAIW